jgi:hypothetical protein
VCTQCRAWEKHVLANRAGYSSRQPLRGWRHTYIVSAISAKHRWVLEMRRAAAAGSHCPPSEEDPPPAPAPAPAPALLPPREAPPGAEDGLLMPIGPMNVSTSDGPQECTHAACDNNSVLSEPVPLDFGRGRYTPTKAPPFTSSMLAEERAAASMHTSTHLTGPAPAPKTTEAPSVPLVRTSERPQAGPSTRGRWEAAPLH